MRVPAPVRTALLPSILFFAALAGSHAQPAAAPVDEIVPKECLILTQVAQGGRSAIHRDAVEAKIVAGTWKTPIDKETLTLPNGNVQTWTLLSAGADGAFRGRGLGNGYASITVNVDKEQVRILEASGHSMVYVNGEPRTGDPYGTGWTRLPVLLHKGANELLFLCGRGEFRVKLIAPQAPMLLDPRDMTLPDLLVGESPHTWGAVVVLNASTEPLQQAQLHVHGEGFKATTINVPVIPPLSMRKVGFRIEGGVPSKPGVTHITLNLTRHGAGEDKSEPVKVELRLRAPTATYKRTFLSDIDGSVQYYAVNPAHPLTKTAPPPALFLSLHGAGVEAIGQADAYEGKTWGDLVAPTNRRPYGFDWEDWGRLDALEVLDIAQKTLHPDPQRIYLTGHSMGGHGTWQVGATFPDRFAAIGPSAGWISFYTYAGGARPENPNPVEEMLIRANSPSDTLGLLPNYAQEGVYILHGSADDNVPVGQAREMQTRLSAFHHDVTYFEQPGAGHWWDVSDEPGADCVDWAPMFDFFARHARPLDESVRQVDFVTANPGVSAWSHWACIETQLHPLRLSTIHLRYDPGQRRFVGTTENVARLTLDVAHVDPTGELSLELDGQKLTHLLYPTATHRLWLERAGGNWSLAAAPTPDLKNPRRCGPFKLAFQHRMVFVYGTKGTPEENDWAFSKARYDAETFWYRGNGSVDVVADTAFDTSKDRDRSVILYGNADTNAAWSALLSTSPVEVKHGQIRIGEKAFTGGDLACLFLRPRPGSETACVAAVSGTGPVGMRLATRLPIFVSGLAYPDCLVVNAESLSKGTAGVRAAGFFGPDWGVTTGDFIWPTSGS
ncbi:MAG TPA: prolyl oligopeptidase family serine peptidase [Chthonomonadaceae bacterium]|nr:prolyl oligopeptidase family serine peptidase [Chthonomonadaceae bacterium]